MINRVGIVCQWVFDYDEGFDFYVNKVGLKVSMDAPMEGGAGRWVLLYAADQPEVPIMLAVPGPPIMDAETAAKVRELVSTGYLGFGGLATDDCQKTYEELKAKGVDFVEEPTERFYGIDASFRDPFGNQLRLTQPKPMDEITAP